MFMHVIEAKYIDDYRLWVSFNDGAKGEVDLSPELFGELFEPLKDKLLFNSFKLEGHTIAWDNGADFTPEFLRENIT